MSIVTHMEKGLVSYANPTYQEIHDMCYHISQYIHYNATPIGKVGTILGVTRGGLMPAVILSHMLTIPMKTIEYSSKQGKGDDKNHANVLPSISEESILLVEDICDSGHTLNDLVRHYEREGHKVYSAVLYFKDIKDKLLHTPDVWAIKISKSFGFINFPWEK